MPDVAKTAKTYGDGIAKGLIRDTDYRGNFHVVVDVPRLSHISYRSVFKFLYSRSRFLHSETSNRSKFIPTWSNLPAIFPKSKATRDVGNNFTCFLCFLSFFFFFFFKWNIERKTARRERYEAKRKFPDNASP